MLSGPPIVEEEPAPIDSDPLITSSVVEESVGNPPTECAAPEFEIRSEPSALDHAFPRAGDFRSPSQWPGVSQEPPVEAFAVLHWIFDNTTRLSNPSMTGDSSLARLPDARLRSREVAIFFNANRAERLILSHPPQS